MGYTSFQDVNNHKGLCGFWLWNLKVPGVSGFHYFIAVCLLSVSLLNGASNRTCKLPMRITGIIYEKHLALCLA